jgi:exodeoxyribonuclease VII small subunit
MSNEKKVNTSKTPKFEEALKKLETIVGNLESDELDLDKALGMFEEGVRLARLCTAKLEEAKRKIELIEKKGGKLALKPFESEDPDEEEEDANT